MITHPTNCLVTSQLPGRAVDGKVVCDKEGNAWQYSATAKTWLEYGSFVTPALVTETTDGLITPDLFARLETLKELTNNGRTLPPTLKLRPHVNAHWYYFTAPNKLIDFLPEGSDQTGKNRLRIEVNRARLFAFFRGRSCRGLKGPVGPQGSSGLAAPILGQEPCHVPLANSGMVVTFSVTVRTPLATAILLRLAPAAGAMPVVQILVPLAGLPLLDNLSPTIALDQTATLASISFIPTGGGTGPESAASGTLTGSFILTSGTWPRTACVLATQKGPVGPSGPDGTCGLTPAACAVANPGADTNIQFTEPIIAMRLSCDGSQILTTSANMFGTVCVNKLSFTTAVDSGNLFNGPLRIADSSRATVQPLAAPQDKLLAARQTTEQCKALAVYVPAVVPKQPPPLTLPDWRPTGDCNVAKRAQITDLNWPPLATGLSLGTPDGNLPPGYPWTIVTPTPGQAGNCDPCIPVPQGTISGVVNQPDPPCPK